MENRSLIHQLQKELPIEGIETDSPEDLMDFWARYFNELIQFDFTKLLSLLYRIDIPEKKLRLLLRENPKEDAGQIIARMVKERLLQKIKSREENRPNSSSVKADPDLETW